jgi:hypothetical protein
MWNKMAFNVYSFYNKLKIKMKFHSFIYFRNSSGPFKCRWVESIEMSLISSAVGIATDYDLDGRGVGVLFLIGVRFFLPPHRPGEHAVA